ncbi:MAG: inorganic phosphate transporter [Actinomycetota bacterium]|nr:inorganic phosphate transporter [Actinomycetota bacterium]
MDSDIILVIVVVTALAFDFTNGFHDTANAVATSISTRALAPKTAVTLSAILNFVGAFISIKVAATVAGGIVDSDLITTTVIFAGLIGAISWNLVTWYFGLPSSSSHALIGGVVGAAFAASGADAILGGGLLEKVIVPALVAPIVAFVTAGMCIVITYRMVGRLRPGSVNRGYRLGQIVSASLLSLSHGTNDAQKTMGIITLALIAHGTLSGPSPDPPTWVIVSAALAIALGTYTGGWRIIRTMGSRIYKMDPAQGFAAQGGGAAVLLTASHLGFPLSTTHSITGAVLGAGAAKSLSAVRWGLAGNIAAAWVLTLPAAAAVGALTYGVSRIFGSGALGPLLISVSLLMLVAAMFGKRLRHGPAITGATTATPAPADT